jgi:hypothetical protein
MDMLISAFSIRLSNSPRCYYVAHLLLSKIILIITSIKIWNTCHILLCVVITIPGAICIWVTWTGKNDKKIIVTGLMVLIGWDNISELRQPTSLLFISHVILGMENQGGMIPTGKNWQRQRIFPLTSVSRLALGPTQPPVQWVPAVLSPGQSVAGAWRWPFTPI